MCESSMTRFVFQPPFRYGKSYWPPVPCQHIADYYHFKWSSNPQLGSNLLRRGYRLWAAGAVKKSDDFNNLYTCAESPSTLTLGALP